MAGNVTRIRRDALQLSRQARAGLAADLLDSLAPDDALEPLDDAAWIAEIERRARAARSGAQGISWQDAKARIRKRLKTK